MSLQRTKGDHMANRALDSLADGPRLIRTGSNNHDLTGIHNSAHTNRECHTGHILLPTPEKPRIGRNRILSKRLNPRATSKATPGFIESDMPIGPHAAKEKINPPQLFDASFVAGTLRREIRSEPVEKVYILGLDVDVCKKVRPHERVVALRVCSGEAHVLVHVEGDDVRERELTGSVERYQVPVHRFGRAASGEAEHEGARGAGCEGIDSRLDVACDVERCCVGRGPDDEAPVQQAFVSGWLCPALTLRHGRGAGERESDVHGGFGWRA